MAPDLSLEQGARLEHRPTVALVAYARLLAASAVEVDHLVEAELRENPALERDDERPPRGLPGLAAAAAREPADETGTLARIALDARVSLPARDHGALEYLLGSLDERGFLTLGHDEIAAAVGVPVDRVAAVHALVRELGPVGIASRDVRDCLTVQLAQLDDDPQLVELARRLIDGALADLAAGRYGALARAYGVERALVVAARDLIRRRLRPFPVLEAPLRGGRAESLDVPEVIILRCPDEPRSLRVELSEERRHELKISPSFAAVARASAGPGAADRERAAAQVRRAHAFMRRLGERWSTMRRVVEHTAREQRAFVLEGPGALRPLTRAQVAASLGLHESTVSRVVAGRSALLPCGGVYPLSAFFEASLSVQQALRDLVAGEARPLSDGELATALADSGHRVARRTIAKYRARLDIPPSARRSPGEGRFAAGACAANGASPPAGATSRDA